MWAGDDSAKPFLDRELSWLDFNQRVLSKASEPSVPLLERVRFLSVHAENLDEFFQLQVSGVQETVRTGVNRRSNAGYTPIEQLKQIRRVASDQMRTATQMFNDDLRPALAEQGILLAQVSDLDARLSEWISQQFAEQIFPVLTPLAVDLAHPFPYISDLSLNLAVLARHDNGTHAHGAHAHGAHAHRRPKADSTAGSTAGPGVHPSASHSSQPHAFARVKVPPVLPRFVHLADEGRDTFVALEDIIAAHLSEVFPGIDVAGHSAFRLTRDAEIEVDDTRTDDLMKQLEYELSQRRFGEPVRLEVANSLDEYSLEMLTRELGLSQDAVIAVPGLLALSDLSELYKIDRPDLKFEPHRSRITAALDPDKSNSADLFATVKQRDVLLHFPYESFNESVATFIRTAAHDPDVLAIKMTMYRISERTPLVDWLIEAAERGKQVVVVVELKARFDEHANIGWARQLEQAGVHVSYGLAGLKTHCKIALVVRREGRNNDQIRRYVHIGTGNYNADTAKYYEDLGLLSADESIAHDISQLFNKLTGYSRHVNYNKMLIAPDTLSAGLHELIADQADRNDGYIFIKTNAVVDATFIEALYDASTKGCKIDLIVRGICCLVPGVPGVSENIRVRSVVGRFLEHGRIYRFGAGGGSADDMAAGDSNTTDGSQFLIGSPDPMPRNLYHRVEALVPVSDEQCKAQLAAISESYLADDIERWELDADGEWHHHSGVSLHQRLAESGAESGAGGGAAS